MPIPKTDDKISITLTRNEWSMLMSSVTSLVSIPLNTLQSIRDQVRINGIEKQLSPEERASKLIQHLRATGEKFIDPDYVFVEITEAIRDAGTESAKKAAELIRRGDVNIEEYFTLDPMNYK